jgi:hypothetical protein
VCHCSDTVDDSLRSLTQLRSRYVSYRGRREGCCLLWSTPPLLEGMVSELQPHSGIYSVIPLRRRADGLTFSHIAHRSSVMQVKMHQGIGGWGGLSFSSGLPCPAKVVAIIYWWLAG